MTRSLTFAMVFAVFALAGCASGADEWPRVDGSWTLTAGAVCSGTLILREIPDLYGSTYSDVTGTWACGTHGGTVCEPGPGPNRPNDGRSFRAEDFVHLWLCSDTESPALLTGSLVAPGDLRAASLYAAWAAGPVTITSSPSTSP